MRDSRRRRLGPGRTPPPPPQSPPQSPPPPTPQQQTANRSTSQQPWSFKALLAIVSISLRNILLSVLIFPSPFRSCWAPWRSLRPLRRLRRTTWSAAPLAASPRLRPAPNPAPPAGASSATTRLSAPAWSTGRASPAEGRSTPTAASATARSAASYPGTQSRWGYSPRLPGPGAERRVSTPDRWEQKH